MLLVRTEGVPLIVHVPVSKFMPVGSAGDTVHVAPVTSVMPLPEPLAALESYWKVMSSIASSTNRSAPSMLGMSS